MTYFTLLTIVPVLGMAFGIAKAFGMDALLEEQIRLNFQGQETIMDRILAVSNNLLENTREEIVAGIGLVILLWSVIRILINIENTLNAIWNVKKARTVIQKLVDYSAFVLIAPALMALSSGLTVYISSIVKGYTENSEIIGSFSPIFDFPLKILPYAIIWILLTFIYLVMPNRKVDLKSALIGGILAGTAYQLTQWGYIRFQVSATNINAIYGSFAALPLFLIWVQLSWTLVLFGAEISYAVQTLSEHEQKDDIAKISKRHKKVLSLLVAHRLIKQFVAEEPALKGSELSEQLDIPPRILQDILNELLDNRIITATQNDENKELSYQPARDTNKLTVYRILEILEKRGVNDLNMDDSPALKTLTEVVDNMRLEGKDSTQNLLLKDIV